MDPNDLAGGNPAGWLKAGAIGLSWGLQVHVQHWSVSGK